MLFTISEGTSPGDFFVNFSIVPYDRQQFRSSLVSTLNLFDNIIILLAYTNDFDLN